MDSRKVRLARFITALPEAGIATDVADIGPDDGIAAFASAAGADVDALADVVGVMEDKSAVHELGDDVWERGIGLEP